MLKKLVLAILILALVGWGAYRLLHPGPFYTKNPAEVERRVAHLLPGCRPPAGYRGGMAFANGPSNGAVLAPLHGGETKPGECRFALTRIELTPSGQSTVTGSLARHEPVPFEVGNQTINGYRRLEGGELTLSFAFRDKKGRLLMLAAVGPENGFPLPAVQQLLDSLDLDQLETITPARQPESRP